MRSAPANREAPTSQSVRGVADIAENKPDEASLRHRRPAPTIPPTPPAVAVTRLSVERLDDQRRPFDTSTALSESRASDERQWRKAEEPEASERYRNRRHSTFC